MIGIVVVTHAGLAREIKEAAELILGPLTGVETISIDRDLSVEVAKDLLGQALERVGSDGDGALILTDMFGGTPTNISAEFLVPGQVEILTGVNLPMLIKCSSARYGKKVDVLADEMKDYAQKTIMRPAELLLAAKS
ncbi:MAG: PTS system fructose subfamily IIA component [Azoarcus sp.]|nr:MAG: PTS system fructose subfamily IIA component [Azoarcus sp.]